MTFLNIFSDGFGEPKSSLKRVFEFLRFSETEVKLSFSFAMTHSNSGPATFDSGWFYENFWPLIKVKMGF